MTRKQCRILIVTYALSIALLIAVIVNRWPG
jgi:hypothetical protein